MTRMCNYNVTPTIWPNDGRHYADVLPERRRRFTHNAALMDKCNAVLADTWVCNYKVCLEVGLAAYGFLRLTVCGGANALCWYGRAWHTNSGLPVSPTFKGRGWEPRMLEWLRQWGTWMHYVIRDAQD